MKVYNLSCEHDHRFEGWFAGADEFIAQCSQGRIECPVCGSCGIKKLPSAPRLNLSGAQVPDRQRSQALQAQWIATARAVLANTEDVGDSFAEEARRIHYHEIPERGIRGVATPAERDALTEEGIDVMAFPIPAALKQPLQ